MFPTSKKGRANCFHRPKKKLPMHYFLGGKHVFVFFGGGFCFFLEISSICYVPCKKIYNVFILTFAVFFRVSMRFSTWNDERVLTFFVFGPCVSENDPPKNKNKKTAPANPQPTPNPQKKHTWPMLCWLAERKSKSNWTSPAKLLPDPTGH